MQSHIFLNVVLATSFTVPKEVISEVKHWWHEKLKKTTITISLRNINVIVMPPKTIVPSMLVYWIHSHTSFSYPRFAVKRLNLMRIQFNRDLSSRTHKMQHFIATFGNYIQINTSVLPSSTLPDMAANQPVLRTSQAPFLLELPDSVLHHILHYTPSSLFALRASCSHLSRVYLDSPEVSFTFSASVFDIPWKNLPSYRCFSTYNASKRLAIHNPETIPLVEQWIQNLPPIMNLTSLDMTGTRLYKNHVPYAFSQFTNLTELHLVDCKLEDLNGTCAISTCIAKNTSLVTLSLASNPHIAHKLFAEYLGNLLQYHLTQLRTLNLSDTETGDEFLYFFLRQASFNVSLTMLDLSQNLIFYDNPTHGFPTSLHSLSLAQNVLFTSSFIRLVQHLQQRNHALTALDVRNNEIDRLPDFSVKSLPSIQVFNTIPLSQIQRGSRLCLPYRALDAADFFTVLPAPNANLQYLDISNNYIAASGVCLIPLIFQRMPNLTYLDISNNELMETHCELILNLLPESLSTLKISENNLQHKAAINLGFLIPSLTHLDISLNHIDTSILQHFHFKDASKLTNLNISHNLLDDTALPIIRHHILNQHPNLTHLDLSHNRFTNPNPYPQYFLHTQ